MPVSQAGVVIILQWFSWRHLLVCEATQSTCPQMSQALGAGPAGVRACVSLASPPGAVPGGGRLVGGAFRCGLETATVAFPVSPIPEGSA